ncbi:MAG: PHP domain-containing protein, partial [Candidatus Tectomicrobia bacterium]|nr:PHP domain-containing protein [Candidatus Tectomicrobia bacterium]
MFIDMHSHTVASDDSTATAEAYMKWINVLRKKNHQIDGVVFTEHRDFDFEINYDDLARQYNVVILKGAEVETNCGHFLLYGVTERLTKQFNFRHINIDVEEFLKEVEAAGSIAVPCHPGRRFIGICDYIDNGKDYSRIKTIELLNGGSNSEENAKAAKLMEEKGFHGIGGSDSHFVSSI